MWEGGDAQHYAFICLLFCRVHCMTWSGSFSAKVIVTNIDETAEAHLGQNLGSHTVCVCLV